jgi:hypothetical protein
LRLLSWLFLGLCRLWWWGRGDLLLGFRVWLIRQLLGGLLRRDDGVGGVGLVVDGELLCTILLLLEELLIGGEFSGCDPLVESVCGVCNGGGGGCVLVGGGGELLLYAGEMMHVESEGFHYDWGHF